MYVCCIHMIDMLECKFFHFLKPIARKYILNHRYKFTYFGGRRKKHKNGPKSLNFWNLAPTKRKKIGQAYKMSLSYSWSKKSTIYWNQFDHQWICSETKKNTKINANIISNEKKVPKNVCSPKFTAPKICFTYLKI